MIRTGASPHSISGVRASVRVGLAFACLCMGLAVPAHAERVLPDIFVRPQKPVPQQYRQPVVQQARPLFALDPQQGAANMPAETAPSSASSSTPVAQPADPLQGSGSATPYADMNAPASSSLPEASAAAPPSNPFPTDTKAPSGSVAPAIPSLDTPAASVPQESYQSPPGPPQAYAGEQYQAASEQGFTPPPLSDSSLQNAVQSEAERAFYERRRKRMSDTMEMAYEGLVPLGPNEVRDVMGRYERTQRAAVPPSTGQPRGQVRITTLSLEPGSEPPTVNVAAGYVTTIAIVDATGQPWPILDVGIGGNFEVSKTGGGSGTTHVVRIMPLTRFGFGNLSVLLQDLSTPIIFKLASGGTTVDYRFDGRVPRMGPNAKLSLIERKTLQAGSAIIMTFLDNAPPPDAKRVKVSGTDSRTMAWRVNDRMYVRTPLTMLSPSWDASVSSADGTTVYELKESPALLMSDNGTLVRARVMQKEEE